MADPIWFLGPDWDLQPLVCPERDFDITPVRYGGIFQGLSGARTVSNTGLKYQYTMDLTYLTPEEYGRLEALHFRRIPGPHRLISPLKKNRLSADGSIVKAGGAVHLNHTGFSVYVGATRKVLDWPSAAGTEGAVSTGWTISLGAGNYGRFDSLYKTPVTAGQPVTGSVWLKCANAGTIELRFDWFDKAGVQIGNTAPTGVVNLDTSWTRKTLTATPPAGAVNARFAFVSPSESLVSAELFVAAAQVEVGPTATSWSPGGGAPRVAIDQMAVKTPRFPYTSTTITILEE
jgi:hypothetical protein